MIPYPVVVQGEVAGKKTAIALKMTRDDKARRSAGHRRRVRVERCQRQGGHPRQRSEDYVDRQPDLDRVRSRRSSGAARSGVGRQAGASGRRPTSCSRDAPVPFDALRAHDANGEVTIDRLILPGGRALNRVHARFRCAKASSMRRSVQVAAYGGSISEMSRSTRLAVGRRRLRLRLEGRGLDLAALLAIAGVTREVRGGKTNVDVDVTMRGDSPHQWMSGINGRARAVVGPATLVNTKLDMSLTLDRLAEAVNPFRKVNPSTELQCAVIRLPLTGGVAQVDRSIAIETREIDASDKRDARFQKRDARPLDPAAGPARDPHRDSADSPSSSAFAGPSRHRRSASMRWRRRRRSRVSARPSERADFRCWANRSWRRSARAPATGACEVALGKTGSATTSAAARTGKVRSSANPVEGIGNALKGLFQR